MRLGWLLNLLSVPVLMGFVNAAALIICLTQVPPLLGLAMPHSQQGSEGVFNTAIGFMKVEKPVSFVEGDPEKYANIFFTLASCNPTEHLANMSQLAEMLGDDDLLQDLLENVHNEEDLLRVADKYPLG